MPAILASLRSADLSRLGQELDALTRAGVDGVHLDVMDGRFCGEVALPLEQVKPVREHTDLMLDVHLMVEDPEFGLDSWIDSGVQRISFHLEACPQAGPALLRIRTAGLKPGLVILPSTPVVALEPWLELIDYVNPLGVNPVQGTGFDPSTFDRIRALVQWRGERGLEFLVQADGGVWAKTRDELVAAGADELVGGYPIFSQEDYGAAVHALRTGEPTQL